MKIFVPPSKSNVSVSSVFFLFWLACLSCVSRLPAQDGTKQCEQVPRLAANYSEVALKLAVVSESLGRLAEAACQSSPSIFTSNGQ